MCSLQKYILGGVGALRVPLSLRLRASCLLKAVAYSENTTPSLLLSIKKLNNMEEQNISGRDTRVRKNCGERLPRYHKN